MDHTYAATVSDEVPSITDSGFCYASVDGGFDQIGLPQSDHPHDHMRTGTAAGTFSCPPTIHESVVWAQLNDEESRGSLGTAFDLEQSSYTCASLDHVTSASPIHLSATPDFEADDAVDINRNEPTSPSYGVRTGHYSNRVHADSGHAELTDLGSCTAFQARIGDSVDSSRRINSRSGSGRSSISSSPQTPRSRSFAHSTRISRNQRVEFAEDLNIHEIDHRLAHTRDPIERKRLRDQKRLISNRAAALSSRQRKKQYTEDLETEVKRKALLIEQLERQVRELQEQCQTLNAGRLTAESNVHLFADRLQAAEREIECLEDARRDDRRKHTEVTSTLRRRIQILEEPLPASSAMLDDSYMRPGSFADDMAQITSGFQSSVALGMGGDMRDISLHTYEPSCGPARNDQPLVSEANNSQSATMNPVKQVASFGTATEQSMGPGLLFCLLLCGAFVVSKRAGPRSEDLPQVPADVRAAAPHVLNSLLADPTGTTTRPALPRSLSSDTPSPTLHQPDSNLQLENTYRQLITLSRQQEIDAAFALTSDQYAAIAHPPLFEDANLAGPSQFSHTGTRRSYVAEARSSNCNDQAGQERAAVYSRSLLWPQISSERIEQFKEYVRDRAEIEEREELQRQQQDDLFDFDWDSFIEPADPSTM